MSFPAYPPQVRALIVERLAAGETLKAVCAQPSMPCQESVNGWMRRDPGFAAEVALARRRGEHRRRFACDEAVARSVLARIAAGERIGAVLAEPGTPSRATWRYWMATQGWLAEAVGHVLAVRRAERSLRMRRRRRAFDPAVAERLYVRLWMGGASLREVLASDPAFPSLSVLARWRREDARFDGMLRFVFGAWRTKRGRTSTGKGRGVWSRGVEEAVFGGLVDGESLRSLGRRADLPCAGTLYAWCRTRPDFAAMVARACGYRDEVCGERMLEIAERVGPGGVTAARKAMARLNAQRTRLRKRPGWKGRAG
jgi:hypothetical protein